MTTNDSTQGPDTPDTPREDALADRVFDEPTRPVPTAASAAPTTWAPAPGSAATATAVRIDPASTSTEAPPRQYVKGPAPFAIVLGLLGLVVAAVTLFSEVVGLDVPWGDLGPWTVVGAGVLVLLVGGLGLRASRNQD